MKTVHIRRNFEEWRIISIYVIERFLKIRRPNWHSFYNSVPNNLQFQLNFPCIVSNLCFKITHIGMFSLKLTGEFHTCVVRILSNKSQKWVNVLYHWSISISRFRCKMISLTELKTTLMFSVSTAVVKWWKRGLRTDEVGRRWSTNLCKM